MKKSILSLSAAVALGGLGLVSTANAIIVYDNTSTVQTNKTDNTGVTKLTLAKNLYQHAAGTGHILMVPYFSAQGNNATLINIVNTDTLNGKAVKVRFRNATNSDDVLDFTLLLSPGDVWSGSVSVGGDGYAAITHSGDETTCTLPRANDGDWITQPDGSLTKPFFNYRLPTYLTTAQQAALTREGYVEILNMADIVPDSAANSVYYNIVHQANHAACEGKVRDLLNLTVYDSASAYTDYDLAAPSGGLMGSWAIMNQAQMGTFSGTQTAMIATNDTGGVGGSAMGVNGTAATALGALSFFPQNDAFYASAYGVSTATDATNVVTTGSLPTARVLTAVTADPLLVGGATSLSYAASSDTLKPTPGTLTVKASTTDVVAAQWFDLPDLSTPYISGFTAPQDQAALLTRTLLKTNLMNEWIATASSASVPFNTDWVVSQPSRRYHVAVNYGTSAGQAKLVWSDPTLEKAAKPYVGYYDVKLNSGAYGPVACLQFALGALNREEGGLSGGAFSPGGPAPTCGEVFTLQFSNVSPLAAQLTTSSVAAQAARVGQAGWAQLNLTTAAAQEAGGVPMLGFAATQFSNQSTGAIYNETFQHRWTGQANTTTTP